MSDIKLPKVEQELFDVNNENLQKLASLFPSAVKDGQLDIDALKEELGQFEEVGQEKYELTWAGKQNAKKEARRNVLGKTLRYIEGDGVDKDEYADTQNLYIEGDNLEVLKLLRKNYYGKIKMIYIDPPYNTGNDFVYNDNFSMTQEELEQMQGERDEYGEKLQKNSKDSAKYHTNWLNMMYPRLQLAKDLLTEDGVIFISIDEKEVTNLIKICNLILGDDNYLETFHIQVRYSNKSLNEDSDFQPVMEYVLCYAKNKYMFKPQKPSEPYDLSKFVFSFNELTNGQTIQIANKTVTIFKAGEWTCKQHEQGKIGLLKETWASGSIVKQGGTAAEFLAKHLIHRKNEDGLGVLYKIHNMGEDGLGYRYVTGPLKEDAIRGKFYSGIPLDIIQAVKDGTALKYKPIPNFYDYSADFGNIRNEGGIAFNSGKKPIKLLESLINIANLSNEDIVLDFFSGSASFAHSVMEYNKHNNKSVSYIMVQIPEKTYELDNAGIEKPLKHAIDAYNLGLKTICEIGKERIRRAGKKIKEEIEAENQQLKLGEEPKKVPDIGFKVFRVGETTLNWEKLNLQGKDIYHDYIAGTSEKDKLDFTPDFKTDLNVVYEIMLRQEGLPLTSKIEKLTDIGSRTYLVADSYLISLEEDITPEMVEKLSRLNPLPIKFVFRDSAFDDNIVFKDETFRRLNALIDKNTSDEKKTYTVEFI